MRAVYLASVWLHVLAAMTWVGGMVIFAAAVMPYFRTRPELERTTFLAWFGPRFGAVAWWCYAILLVTGIFNLWARGVRFEDFLSPEWRATGFGHAVLLKLFLVLCALAVSVVHLRARFSPKFMGRVMLVIGVAIVLAAVLMVRGG